MPETYRRTQSLAGNSCKAEKWPQRGKAPGPSATGDAPAMREHEVVALDGGARHGNGPALHGNDLRRRTAS
jgi:hypothetical protein